MRFSTVNASFVFNLLTALLISLVVPAAPAEARDTAVIEAQEIFLTAKGHFEKGRYAKALAELERAYEIKKLTVFLRYMGDCHMKLARYEDALSAYTRYLRKKPDAPDRAQVEAEMAVASARAQAIRKKEYEGKVVPSELMPTGTDGEEPRLRARRAPPPAAAPVERPRFDDIPEEPEEPTTVIGVSKWVAGGLGLVGIALGVTFNRLAAERSNELIVAVKGTCAPGDPEPCLGNPSLDTPVAPFQLEHLQKQLEVEQFNQLAVASFVVGGAALAGSVALFVLDWMAKKERRKRRVTFAPTFGSSGAGLVGEVRF